MDELDTIIKIEQSYTRLYASNVRPEVTTESNSSTCDVQQTEEEDVKALNGIVRKAASDDP